MGEMRLGVGQGNNHPVKITDSDFKNLNIFKKKKKIKPTKKPQTLKCISLHWSRSREDTSRFQQIINHSDFVPLLFSNQMLTFYLILDAVL